MIVYAIRDINTKKLLSVKCKGGKYYLRKADAINKCFGPRELVTFELVEVLSKQKGFKYIYTAVNLDNKIKVNKCNNDKFYYFEKYVDELVKNNENLRKVIYELREII